MNPLTEWVMRNGKRIKLKDMSRGHLAATIALINRKVKRNGIKVFSEDDEKLIDHFIESASMINVSKFAMQRELMRRNAIAVMKVKGSN